MGVRSHPSSIFLRSGYCRVLDEGHETPRSVKVNFLRIDIIDVKIVSKPDKADVVLGNGTIQYRQNLSKMPQLNASAQSFC